MKSSQRIILDAFEAGRQAAEYVNRSDQALTYSCSQDPRRVFGSRVLEVLREFGAPTAFDVVCAYQRGYNVRARDLGDLAVRRSQLIQSLALRHLGATDAEVQAILESF